MVNIKPMAGYSLAIPHEEQEEKPSTQTTHLADTAKEQLPQVKSKILKINKNPYISIYGSKVEVPEGLKEGDIVVHETYGWQKFEHEGKKYRMIRHIDISAIIKQK